MSQVTITLQADLRQIRSQVGAFVFAQNTQRQADQGPEMHRVVFSLVMLADIMNLSMAVVAGGNAVLRPGCHDLLEFQPTVSPSGFGKAGLQETTAPTATVIVGAIGKHIHKIFLPHNGFYYKPQIFRHRITKTFSNELAGILNRKLDFQVLVPVGIDLQFSFPYPLGVILNNAFDLKIVRNVKFFQSSPDCKELVPSLGIEPDLALQIIHGLGFDFDNMFPPVVFSQEHAVIFRSPSLGTVSPVRPCQMQDFP